MWVNTLQIASSQTIYRIGLISWNIWWEVNKKTYCIFVEKSVWGHFLGNKLIFLISKIHML